MGCQDGHRGVGPVGDARHQSVAQRQQMGRRFVTDDRLAASLPGVFAVGAVRAGHGGRLIDAVADGALAAKSVKEALQC